MKVAELKELLKASGKPVGGKKDELIDRLLGKPYQFPPQQPQGIGDLLGQQQPQKGGGVKPHNLDRWGGVKPVGAGPWSDEASFSGNVGDIAKLEGPEAGGMLYDDSDYPEALQEQIAAAWNRLNEIVYNEGVGPGEAYFDRQNLDTIFAPMNSNGVRYLQPGMRSGKIIKIMWTNVMMKMKDNLRYVWPAGLIAA